MSLKKGDTYSLFGGNVTGLIKDVEEPSRLCQSWRLSQWPADHYAQLTIELVEASDSTRLDLILEGVPSGTEDTSESGLEHYYIRGLKSMGLATVL